MEIKLLTSINYKNLDEQIDYLLYLYQNFDDKINRDILREKIKEIVKKLEIDRRSEIVASAGNLSRNPGNVFDVLDTKGNLPLEKNSKFASNVIKMGHTSISELDCLVFALKDISALIEQTIIEERYSAFTVKSRIGRRARQLNL